MATQADRHTARPVNCVPRPLRLAAIFPCARPRSCGLPAARNVIRVGQREPKNRGPHLSKLRTIIITLVALLAAGISQARADGGTVRISFLKAGFVIGGAVGEGTLNFQGRSYRLAVGGISYGFTFG